MTNSEVQNLNQVLGHSWHSTNCKSVRFQTNPTAGILALEHTFIFWQHGCDCHEALLIAGQAVDCDKKGRRASKWAAVMKNRFRDQLASMPLPEDVVMMIAIESALGWKQQQIS